MKLRRFLAAMLGIRDKTPTPPAHPVQAAYADAHMLLTAIYAGRPHSRRAWLRKMGQARWERAVDLLRMAGILDRRGRYVFDHDRDWAQACDDLLAAANAEATRRTSPTYVPAKR